MIIFFYFYLFADAPEYVFILKQVLVVRTVSN